MRGLWLDRFKLEAPRKIPPFKWAQGVLESSKRQDCEPWCIIRRFPGQEPRRGWWMFLKWLERNPEALRIGDLSFGSWQAKIASLRATECGPVDGWQVVELMDGIKIKIPIRKDPEHVDNSGPLCLGDG